MGGPSEGWDAAAWVSVWILCELHTHTERFPVPSAVGSKDAAAGCDHSRVSLD